MLSYRNVILGAALFRQAGTRLAKNRRLSTVTDDGMPTAGDASVDGISHTSADSSNSHDSNVPKLNAVMAQSGNSFKHHLWTYIQINIQDVDVLKFLVIC